MSDMPVATHIYSHLYPELSRDDVSRYVAFLKHRFGEKKIGGVYSAACTAMPVGQNAMNLQRGSVVEIEGERYLCLGSSFMALEFASLEQPGHERKLDFTHFNSLVKDMRVLSTEESRRVLESVMG
jgi:hypothetical protein